MDGVFDARNDVLPVIPAVHSPKAWCKITISSFRYSELAAHYADDRWAVHPLLVVRDVRAVFNSLLGKHYGSNGITAEEPPLRARLRQFKEDYDLFRDRGWPVIRYETLVKDDPEQTLRATCDAMGLQFDEGMLLAQAEGRLRRTRTRLPHVPRDARRWQPPRASINPRSLPTSRPRPCRRTISTGWNGSSPPSTATWATRSTQHRLPTPRPSTPHAPSPAGRTPAATARASGRSRSSSWR